MKSPKETRKELGWKLEDLQKEHGMAGSYVSQIENGKVIPHRDSRQKLEEIYGQKVNWLDVPLYVKDGRADDWYDVEREFRGLINMINGLPEDEKGVFIETAIKQLRIVFEKY